MRALAVLVHRYVGLTMAGFLVIAGLTGCLLVWYHELDTALNPRLMRVEPPHPAGREGPAPMLDPLVLRDRVRQAYPGAAVNHLLFVQASPDAARTFYIEASVGAKVPPPVDEVFVNPYTGEVLGGRKWGDIGAGLTNLMPFVYRLHYSLALDKVGTWALGIIAVLWTLDCFVGAWLTLPVGKRTGRAPHKRWWRRWKPAWRVRWRDGGHKLNFDLHRAGGLWPWALLLVLGWSSVAFNLHDPVYRPVMGTFFELQTDPRDTLPPLATPEPEPALGWPAVLTAARRHAAEQARLGSFHVLAEDRVSYDPRKGFLRYVVRTDRDINDSRGQSAFFIDARSGALIGAVLPSGAASGDTITSWITSLHMAHIWGLPFRLVMTVTGLAVASLSITGVLIWWKKRSARHKRHPRPQPQKKNPEAHLH